VQIDRVFDGDVNERLVFHCFPLLLPGCRLDS
jgi:hypothetical protein